MIVVTSILIFFFVINGFYEKGSEFPLDFSGHACPPRLSHLNASKM